MKNFFIFFQNRLQRIQIKLLLYTNTYSLKFVSWLRIQKDTKKMSKQYQHLFAQICIL